MRGGAGRAAGWLTGGLMLGLGLAPWAGAAWPASSPDRPRPLPARVYAPYVETWLPGLLTTIAHGSGARDLTLAFLQTARPGSCRVSWNGSTDPSMGAGRYVAQAAALVALGGAVIPSFGGYTADTRGTELADSCPSVPGIAAAYESIVSRYGVTRLDFDVESRSLGNPAGIARRNRAIRLVELWAAARGWPLQVQYTLPILPSGLAPSGLAVLRNAIAEGARVDLVNGMAFDYYDGTTNMGAAAVGAATGLERQLAGLYPGRSPHRLWRMVGLTLLPGIDDNPDRREVTTLADVRQVAEFARAHGLGALSIWAIQRDNGGCPGAVDRNRCSGIRQPGYAVSRVLEAYAG